MGKKSRRSRKGKTQDGGVGSSYLPQSSPADALRSNNLLREALEACTLDRMYSFYKEVMPLLELFLSVEKLVTKADMEQDPEQARQTMQAQVMQHVPIGPCNQKYQRVFNKEIEKHGRGINVTFVEGRGKERSCAYTCGFGLVGGKELILQNIHRSMLNSEICNLFNFLYQRHKDGHPLDDGHTMECFNLAFMVVAPDPAEVTLLKVGKTLEPTRLFGISNYEILELVPVGVKPGGNDLQNYQGRLSHAEVLMLYFGMEVKGFQPLRSKVRKLEACSYCNDTHDTTVEGKRLFKCMGCENAFYCSTKCQRLHWKVHKPKCREAGTDKAGALVAKVLEAALDLDDEEE